MEDPPDFVHNGLLGDLLVATQVLSGSLRKQVKAQCLEYLCFPSLLLSLQVPWLGLGLPQHEAGNGCKLRSTRQAAAFTRMVIVAL